MKINLLIALLLTCHSLKGQNKLTTKRLTVFKDATVFVEKEGNFDVKEKVVKIDLPLKKRNPKQSNYNRPNQYVANEIILGTLNVHAKDNIILSRKSVKTKEADTPIESIDRLLVQNKGKRIKINLRGSEEEITGQIYSVDRLISGLHYRDNVSEQTLLLRENNQWQFVSLSEIRNFEFIDTPSLFSESEKKHLILQLEKDKSKQQIELSYLRKGITWTPNYHIDLKADNKFELSLKAVVVNDVEELLNGELNLAVGIPVFKYAAIGDPIFSSDRVIDFVNRIDKSEEAPGTTSRNFINMQSEMNLREIRYGNSVFPILESDTDDDIYTYGIDNVSLGKGERLNLDIAALKGNYEDVYMIDLRSNEYFISSSRSQRKKEEQESNDVWHTIRFLNSAGLPFTTGTVLFRKELTNNRVKPISQGRLDYTPDGEHCYVKMSIAPNILVQDSDKEQSRSKDETGHRGYFVKVQGEIEITNFKEDNLELLIDRNIRGIKLLDSSEDWKVLQTSRYLFENNQTNLVRWKLNMKPQETKIITYTYEVYVMH